MPPPDDPYLPSHVPPDLVKPPLLAGRSSEQRLLRDLILVARDGPPGVAVLLAGETGAGKTALAEWCLAEAASAYGFSVARATCEPFHAGMSFFPIQELNRRLAGSGATVQQLIADGYGTGSNEWRSAASAFDDSTDPATRREYVMATFANAVIAKARTTKGPVLVFLDDAERIDTPSVDALTVLLSRLPETRVLLIVAFRSDVVAADKEHTFRPIVERARRGSANIQLLEVGLVPDVDLPELVATFLDGATDIPELFLRRLARETEGNPMHVREVLRALRNVPSQGDAPLIKEDSQGSWVFGTSSELWDLPRSIEDAIASRLAPLSEPERSALESAAVIGRRCRFETLRMLTGSNENDLLTVLDSLVTQDLLRETPGDPDSVEFIHRKVRDVVYGQLTGLRRTRLHAQVADVLDQQSDLIPQEEWEITIGWHLLKARKYDAASPHLIRAGQRSLSNQAAQEASVHFRNALEALEKSNAPDPRKLADVRLQLGESLKLASQLDAALRELELVSSTSDSPVSQRWAYDYVGDIHKIRDHLEGALDCYHRAEQMARAANDRELLAEVAADLAELHMREAERLAGIDHEAAEEHEGLYKQYLDMETEYVRDLDSREALARSYRNRAKYARAHGDALGSISLYEQSLSFQDRGVASHQFLIPYAKALRLVGRAADAMTQVNAVLDWSRQIGAVRSEAIARQYRGLLLLEHVLAEAATPDKDQYNDARAEMLRALRLHEETGFRQGYRETSVDLFELEVQAGDFATAVKYLRLGDQMGDFKGMTDREMVDAVLAQLQVNGEHQRSDRITTRLESWSFVNDTQENAG